MTDPEFMEFLRAYQTRMEKVDKIPIEKCRICPENWGKTLDIHECLCRLAEENADWHMEVKPINAFPQEGFASVCFTAQRFRATKEFASCLADCCMVSLADEGDGYIQGQINVADVYQTPDID